MNLTPISPSSIDKFTKMRARIETESRQPRSRTSNRGATSRIYFAKTRMKWHSAPLNHVFG